MYSEEIKIPKDRVAVLIGVKGATKKKLQKTADCKLTVSKDGEVLIEGEDSLTIYLMNFVVKAIGRGFNPLDALILLKDGYSLEVLNIQEYTGKSKAKFTRIKARLIGTDGKARSILERLTHTKISIYGKTVSLLGRIEDVMLCKLAVEKLLKGAPHGNVYKFIELQK
ncbi:MAG: KH domain-containing protein [Candidatus Nanoarchaeia archaeon]|nr:KH domain-containing protein [Candidatus Nanoarchaeia archaeon]